MTFTRYEIQQMVGKNQWVKLDSFRKAEDAMKVRDVLKAKYPHLAFYIQPVEAR